MKTWKHKYPLMHDAFNGKWTKLVQKQGVEYVLRKATIDDIMEAFEVDRATATECYRTGKSPYYLDATKKQISEVKGDDLLEAKE